jgi:hypothetical protein
VPKAHRAGRAVPEHKAWRVPKARKVPKAHRAGKVLPEQALSTYRCIPLRAVTFGKSQRARKPFTFTSSVAVGVAAAADCKRRL